MDSLPKFQVALADIETGDTATVDLETTGLRPFRGDQMIGVAVLARLDAYYFPYRHLNHPNLDLATLPSLYRALERRDILQGHNLKFDLHFMAKDGFVLPEQTELFDTMVAVHLLNENEPSLKLKVLGAKYIDPSARDAEAGLEEALRALGRGKGEMYYLAPEVVEPYACMDVRLTRALTEYTTGSLATLHMMRLALDAMRYLRVLWELEERGLLLDIPLIEQYQAEALERAAKLEAQIQQLAGYELNIRSAKQVQAWLGLESSAAPILERIRDNPAVSLLLEYRAWKKVESTYYRAMLYEADSAGVLHPNLHQTTVVSGRLSASDPNLLAMPKESKQPDIYKVKQVVRAREGFVLGSFDYKQAEIRVGVHYAQERGLAELIRSGADFHSATAAQLGVDRFVAKTINFGIIYGLSAAGLASQLNVSFEEAEEFLMTYHHKYPGFRKLYESARDIAITRGYIRLYTGRRRHYNDPKRAKPHTAINNLIQGTVAEMIREAMLRIRAALPEVHMLLQIHDDILCEIPEDRVDELVPQIGALMCDVGDWLSVPMGVDAKIGKTWGSEEPYEVSHAPTI